MKKLMVAMALVVGAMQSMARSDNYIQQCSERAVIAKVAVMMHDNYTSKEDAMQFLMPYISDGKYGTSETYAKYVMDVAYKEPRNSVDADSLYSFMYNKCLETIKENGKFGK